MLDGPANAPSSVTCGQLLLNAVALSHHGYELNLESRMCPAQQPRDMLGLPERQLALASRDPQRLAQGILHAGSLLAGNSADFKR